MSFPRSLGPIDLLEGCAVKTVQRIAREPQVAIPGLRDPQQAIGRPIVGGRPNMLERREARRGNLRMGARRNEGEPAARSSARLIEAMWDRVIPLSPISPRPQ
jgi:hypothetical protein